MATYNSSVFRGKGIFGASSEVGTSSVQATILIPEGTVLAASDVLNFFRLSGDVVPVRFIVQFDELDSDGTPALTATLGFTQILDPNGVAFLSSPTSDPDRWADASDLTAALLGAGGVLEITLADGMQAAGTAAGMQDGLGGPVNVAITVANAADAGPTADAYITLTCEYVQKPRLETDLYLDRGGY